MSGESLTPLSANQMQGMESSQQEEVRSPNAFEQVIHQVGQMGITDLISLHGQLSTFISTYIGDLGQSKTIQVMFLQASIELDFASAQTIGARIIDNLEIKMGEMQEALKRGRYADGWCGVIDGAFTADKNQTPEARLENCEKAYSKLQEISDRISEVNHVLQLERRAHYKGIRPVDVESFLKNLDKTHLDAVDQYQKVLKNNIKNILGGHYDLVTYEHEEGLKQTLTPSKILGQFIEIENPTDDEVKQFIQDVCKLGQDMLDALKPPRFNMVLDRFLNAALHLCKDRPQEEKQALLELKAKNDVLPRALEKSALGKKRMRALEKKLGITPDNRADILGKLSETQYLHKLELYSEIKDQHEKLGNLPFKIEVEDLEVDSARLQEILQGLKAETITVAQKYERMRALERKLGIFPNRVKIMEDLFGAIEESLPDQLLVHLAENQYLHKLELYSQIQDYYKKLGMPFAITVKDLEADSDFLEDQLAEAKLQLGIS